MKLQVKEMKGVIDKMRGLIGAKRAEAVLLKTRFGIHTFGVRFPIDVVILDRQNSVVKTKENLQPNRIFVWPWKYDTVIELPAGKIEELKLKTGRQFPLDSEKRRG